MAEGRSCYKPCPEPVASPPCDGQENLQQHDDEEERDGGVDEPGAATAWHRLAVAVVAEVVEALTRVLESVLNCTGARKNERVVGVVKPFAHDCCFPEPVVGVEVGRALPVRVKAVGAAVVALNRGRRVLFARGTAYARELQHGCRAPPGCHLALVEGEGLNVLQACLGVVRVGVRVGVGAMAMVVEQVVAACQGECQPHKQGTSCVHGGRVSARLTVSSGCVTDS